MPERVWQAGNYAVPPLDPLDAAVIALGQLIEEGLPDEEAVEPTGFPPLVMPIE